MSMLEMIQLKPDAWFIGCQTGYAYFGIHKIFQISAKNIFKLKLLKALPSMSGGTDTT